VLLVLLVLLLLLGFCIEESDAQHARAGGFRKRPGRSAGEFHKRLDFHLVLSYISDEAQP